MTGQRQSSGASHWEAYWRGTDGGAAVSGDAPGDLFDNVWRGFLNKTMSRRNEATLADIACGVGVVLDYADGVAKTAECKMRLIGIDYAQSAAAAVRAKQSKSGASIWGVAARAGSLPFPNQTFDLVVSQFGVEYAGVSAFAEAARVLAAGGEGLFIAHCRDGGIDTECSGNYAVLNAIETSGLFDAALEGIGAPDGPEPEKKIAAISASLTPLLEGQPSASKQFLSQFLRDAGRLVSRRMAYNRKEAEAWLKAMQKETRLYKERMKAMTDAALNEGEVHQALQQMKKEGVKADAPELLTPAGKTLPAAWKISFRRP